MSYRKKIIPIDVLRACNRQSVMARIGITQSDLDALRATSTEMEFEAKALEQQIEDIVGYWSQLAYENQQYL